MADELQKIVSGGRWSSAGRNRLRNSIRGRLLSDVGQVDGENFRRIHANVLANAFDLYDRSFFAGLCRARLARSGQPLEFSLSKRMTNAAGMTVRHERIDKSGNHRITRFEIKLSATLLFESFRDHGSILVSGCRCDNRIEALMRIMEHEIIHLIEMILWYDSSCTRRRFREIARRCFAHRESTHQLIRPVDTARERFGIHPGDRVAFEFEGRRIAGLVNRITRRATVLVPDPRGTRYSDGQCYAKFYVPITDLKRIE